MNFKTLYILVVSFFSFVSCLPNKNNVQLHNSSTTADSRTMIQKIELTEKTRGTHRLIIFTENSLTIILNGNKTTLPLSSSNWKYIFQDAEPIALEKISSYKSPTTKRYSDAALTSKIIITVNDKTYNSADFDSGKPPKELEALYTTLKRMSAIIK